MRQIRGNKEDHADWEPKTKTRMELSLLPADDIGESSAGPEALKTNRYDHFQSLGDSSRADDLWNHAGDRLLLSFAHDDNVTVSLDARRRDSRDRKHL